MDNNDLILLLGIGTTCVGLAVVVPAPTQAVWLPMLLGIAGTALGLVVLLTVVFR